MHQFSKVELFVVCPGDVAASEAEHQRMLDLQMQFFQQLDLHFRVSKRKIEEGRKQNLVCLFAHFQVLDMPTAELGAPGEQGRLATSLFPYPLPASAYRKFDIEAWMPGRDSFGEISSTSNCTDYQSRRLNTKYKLGKAGGGNGFVHTVGKAVR